MPDKLVRCKRSYPLFKKRPSVVCNEVNNAIYAMKMVAESYGVVFSDAVIGQLYKELDEHLNRMQVP
jgi:hypothetical protein